MEQKASGSETASFRAGELPVKVPVAKGAHTQIEANAMLHSFFIGCAAAALALSVGTAAQADSPRKFLHKATAGDSSEIMLGHLAAHRGGSPGVRDFGRTLVRDHTRAREQAVRVAHQVGAPPSYTPMPQALGRGEFDREFVRYMVHDHRKDISDFRDEAREHDGPVSALAEKQLPVLQKHLDIALSLRDSERRMSNR
jgi:putative membrane protein